MPETIPAKKRQCVLAGGWGEIQVRKGFTVLIYNAAQREYH